MLLSSYIRFQRDRRVDTTYHPPITEKINEKCVICVLCLTARAKNIQADLSRFISIQCHLNNSEASFGLMTQRQLARTKYR